MTRAQKTALTDNLTSALSISEDLFKEMVRLADELAAAKEENEALKREKERLEEQLQLLRETSSDDVIFCVKRPTTL